MHETLGTLSIARDMLAEGRYEVAFELFAQLGPDFLLVPRGHRKLLNLRESLDRLLTAPQRRFLDLDPPQPRRPRARAKR